MEAGIPLNNPPGAKGLKLVFADDFDGAMSISNDGRNARYCAHKPRFGDFGSWAFADEMEKIILLNSMMDI